MDVQLPPPPPPPPPAFFVETTTPQITIPPPPPPPFPPSESVITTTTTAPPPPTTAATPPTQERIWLHPWTATEMRQQASQWTLAGDAGLLLSLEQFSDKLVQRADAIQQHLNQTVNAVKSTHTRVQNCLNEFTSLANTQFIENRVYDEDETINAKASKKDEQSTEKTVSNSEAQEKVLQRYVEAIQYGLAILDTHFEHVEAKLDNIQNGASSLADDDEDVGVPVEPILEPKDPYIFRPLPYLIGTTEFMQDDFVGLGDLLNTHDEETYDVEQIEKVETDSALSSSDQEDDDFQVQVSQAPIVPAGASRPDLANRQIPPVTTTSALTDSEDDDDPFGMNTGPKFDDLVSKKPLFNDNLLKESNMPITHNTQNFNEESDNEESSLFGIPPQKLPSNIEKNNESSTLEELDETEEPKQQMGGMPLLTGGQKGMSELEKAVLRRRKAMGDPDVPIDDDDEEDSKKPTKTKSRPEQTPASVIPNLPSQPGARTATTTEKISRPSIFGGNAPVDDDDDDDNLFNDPPKLIPSTTTTTVTKTDKKPSTIILPKKEKDPFDEDDDLFGFGNDNTPSSSIPIKKNEQKSNIQPIIITKPTSFIPQAESDDEDIFQQKKSPSKPIPTVPIANTIEKAKSPSSDEDLFKAPTITKPSTTPAKITKLSDDEDKLFISKPPVQKSTIPVSSPPVKKPVSLSDENSDEEIFGITNSKPTVPIIQVKQAAAPPTKIVDKKDDADLFNKSKTSPKLPPTTQLQKVVPLSETDDEDDLFNTSTSKPKVLIKDTPQVISPLKSNDNDALFSTPAAKPKAISKQEDDDDDLFPSKSSQIKLPAANVSSPLRSKTVETSKIDTYQDPLSVNKKPTEPTTQPATTKGVTTPAAAQLERKSSSDSDEEESSRKRQLNPAKLKDGEKVDVRKLLKTININPNALKPGTRPKARSITEEAPKSSVVDDGNSTPSTEPAPAPAPAPTAVKNLPKLDSESDDEDLFTSKKKVVPPVSVAEQKKKTDIETEKVNVKDISSRIKINPMMHMPGAQTKQVANEEHESSVNTQTTSTETLKEESTVDKTMLNMYKDRAKVSVKNRAPPTRKTRSSGAAAASSANETDDLFGLSSSNEAAPSSSPTTIPVISPPTVSVTPPPPAPVTGLLDTTVAAGTANAAISDKKTNVKQKKAFSLFDSDDSDTDELLFGSKNKSSAVSKPLPTTTTATSSTTPKTTIKPSVLALDDDDSDFLSKRPIKKGTKRMDNDDIFADVKTKTQQTNKAKKDWSIMNKAAIDDTDDIFNEVSTKSSASSKSKPVNVKNKTIKDLDDIFDDPLNISTK
ncbi:unnamed protein product [Rotaria socialis]|uniref:WASH complex subunit FAM21 n=2 Tax=Rotaria socialis TaxID=392032 RepID=A0A817UH95_9BILA|nr:unnamed protein product [Rotaria socialis]